MRPINATTAFLSFAMVVLIGTMAVLLISLATVTCELDGAKEMLAHNAAIIDELTVQRDLALDQLAEVVTEDVPTHPEPEEAAQPSVTEAVDLTAADVPAGATALGQFKVTHYCCCVQCCGNTAGITKSGRAAVAGYSIAVDPDVIPLGSTVFLDYGDGTLHECRADDTGGAVKGNTIDLCVADHETALALGIRYATVYVAEALK